MVFDFFFKYFQTIFPIKNILASFFYTKNILAFGQSVDQNSFIRTNRAKVAATRSTTADDLNL